MTDPPFDELASAHLDGATTPEEAARVAADPALLARVEELRRVREALAADVPVDPERREAAVAAALDAFDEAEAASVTPLRPVTARRGLHPTVVRVLGAAAAIALLALLVPVLGRLAESSGDDDSAESAADAIDPSTELSDRAEGTPDAGAEAATSTTAPAPVTDLGAFDDVDDLLDALEAGAFSQGLATVETATSANGRGTRCPDGDPGTGSPAPTRADVATATVDGDAVVVVLQRTPGAPDLLLAYQADDCRLLGLSSR